MLCRSLRSALFLRPRALAIGILSAMLIAGCNRAGPAERPAAAALPTPIALPVQKSPAPAPRHRDLAADEALGGHTLARHVGKSDDELRDRLRRESDISAASTYTDQATAERVVEAAISSAGRPLSTWLARKGNRPNLALHHNTDEVIGRSLTRRRREPVPCEAATVVLRWTDRLQKFYVLTSYPEETQ